MCIYALDIILIDMHSFIGQMCSQAACIIPSALDNSTDAILQQASM
jgi:hypothetical protein